jgi:hypothetical protein
MLGQGVVYLGVEDKSWAERLRNARDANAAHLDAVLHVNGARYLRLSHLQQLLTAAGQTPNLELQADLGAEPTLWLDYSHRVRMEPDSKTFRLSFMGATPQTLLETEDVNAMREASQNVLAHAALNRTPTIAAGAETAKVVPMWSFGTLGYVWLTGVITGAALWAMASIYLK